MHVINTIRPCVWKEHSEGSRTGKKLLKGKVNDRKRLADIVWQRWLETSGRCIRVYGLHFARLYFGRSSNDCKVIVLLELFFFVDKKKKLGTQMRKRGRKKTSTFFLFQRINDKKNTHTKRQRSIISLSKLKILLKQNRTTRSESNKQPKWISWTKIAKTTQNTKTRNEIARIC